jgi:hypothetical protein
MLTREAKCKFSWAGWTLWMGLREGAEGEGDVVALLNIITLERGIYVRK